jgi:hypothetical protein
MPRSTRSGSVAGPQHPEQLELGGTAIGSIHDSAREPKHRGRTPGALLGALMTKSNELRFGPISENAIHLCAGMQRTIAEATDWNMPCGHRIRSSPASFPPNDSAQDTVGGSTIARGGQR